MTDSPSVQEIEVRGLVVGLFQENVWIIGNKRTREAICIDPGDQADDVLDLAKDMGMTIKAIACSHGHIDHVLGVPGVQAATGATFYLNDGDAEMLSQVKQQALMFGMAVEQPPAPDHYLADGDTVEVDGLALQVLHTPGHTPGSIAFYHDQVLFSGDTLFNGSIGRTDLPGGDYQQEMNSIVDKLLTLPDETIVLPGHMNETRIGHERATNPFVLQELQRRGHPAPPSSGGAGLILPN